MNPLTALLGTAVTATVAVTGVQAAPAVLDLVSGASAEQRLAQDVYLLGADLLGTTEVPAALTCVPDAAKPCASFAEHDFAPASGLTTFVLTHTDGGNFVLTGTDVETGATAVFDTASGVDLSGSPVTQSALATAEALADADLPTASDEEVAATAEDLLGDADLEGAEETPEPSVVKAAFDAFIGWLS